jgi:protein-S-isoprenylcysteine O-methyltransferase Ste14
LIGLLYAYLPAYTDRKEFWTFDGDAIRWLGVVLFAAGWCAADLAGVCARPPVQRISSHSARAYAGHDWSLWRRPPPELSGLLVNSLGWALAFRSGVGVLLTALLILPLVARIRAEEGLLRSQFGGEYEAYRSRTSRLIPEVY